MGLALGTSMIERILGTFPDVIQLLRNDHKQVRSLFSQYAKASDGEKPQIAQRIVRELTIHTAIEERVVYPAFRAVSTKLSKPISLCRRCSTN